MMKKSGWAFPDNVIDPIRDIEENEWYSIDAMWYELNSAGSLVQRNSDAHWRFFHYTPENAVIVRRNSKIALANVSCGNPTWMNALCATASKRTTAINALIKFCNDNNFDGVGLDFEAYGKWTATHYTNYKTFLTELGNALHAGGLILTVEVPPIWDTKSQGWYKLKYEDFNTLPVDSIVIMSYDYQWDYGAGALNQPLDWLKQILHWARIKIIDKEKIVAGIPAAGYSGVGYDIVGRTYEYLSVTQGFSTAKVVDGEKVWENGGVHYAAIFDIDAKFKAAQDIGITNYAIWHIGENKYE